MTTDAPSGTHYLFSEPDQYEAFKATPENVPILMLNLVRFYPVAQYASDHSDKDKGRSGAEAFAIYREMIAPIFSRLGARQVFQGAEGLTMIGPSDEYWDYASLNEYSNVAAFLDMMRDPDYRIASKHRQAAIADSRTIRLLSPASRPALSNALPSEQSPAKLDEISGTGKSYTLYTDGACSGNPGPGGWGALILINGDKRELFGGEAETTNNRMELMGAIEALSSVEVSARIDLHTDSKYVRDGITKWIANWKRNGWRTAAKKPVKNQDLWQRLDDIVSSRDINWHWVKGHDGDPGNERADELANKGMADYL